MCRRKNGHVSEECSRRPGVGSSNAHHRYGYNVYSSQHYHQQPLNRIFGAIGNKSKLEGRLKLVSKNGDYRMDNVQREAIRRSGRAFQVLCNVGCEQRPQRNHMASVMYETATAAVPGCHVFSKFSNVVWSEVLVISLSAAFIW